MIRIGIAGIHGIGRKHYEVLRNYPDAEVTSIIDINTAHAASITGRNSSVEWFSSAEECLSGIDVLYICTPPAFHKDIAAAALKAGKDVFCEKPIAVTVEEAQEMVETAEQYGRILAAGFNMRYRDSYRKFKELIDQGTAGDAVTYWCQRLGRLQVGRENWRKSSKQSNKLMGMTVESLSHDIDTIRWLFGGVKTVSAQLRESDSTLPGFDDNAVITFEMENGMLAGIQASWSSRLGSSLRGLTGTEGAVYMEGRDTFDVDRIRWAGKEDASEQVLRFHDTLNPEAYRGISEVFLRAVQTRDVSAIPAGEDGLQALKIALAAKESARHGGKPVSL